MGQGGRFRASQRRGNGRAPAIVASVATIAALLVVVSIGFAGPAVAAPGGLDPSFGSGGVVTNTGGSGATGVAVVPPGLPGAGDIIVSGDTAADSFQITGFNPSGAALWQDSLFTGGQALGVTVVPAGLPHAGQVVAVGSNPSGNCASVVEVDPSSGASNSGFGSGGVASLCLANPAQFAAVTVDGSGNVVAAGQADTVGSTTPETLLARFTPTGALDTSFAAPSGYTVAPVPGTSTSAADAVAVSGGVIYTGGYSVPLSGNAVQSFTVAAFNSTGGYATGFNGSGVAVGSAGVAKGLAVLGDGSILAAGENATSASPSYELTDYSTSGTARSWAAPSTGASEWDAVAYQPYGNLVVTAGTAPDTGSGNSIVVAQYNASSGALNPSFGAGGLVSESFGADNAEAAGVAVQPDGKTVAAGSVPRVHAVTQMGVMRFLGPTVSVADPAEVTVFQDGPVTVNFPVQMDEPVGTETVIAVCAGGGTIGGSSCIYATIPAGQTSTSVAVTADVTNTPGHTQTVALSAYTGSGFVASSSSATGQATIQHLAPPPGYRGYWFVASDGGVFAFGPVHFYGSTGGVHLAQPIVAMAATPDGRGYWLVAADGGIFAFGDAHFYGSTGGVRLAQPILSMASTPDGRGYWLVASDGGIFAFGDAHFYGSTGGVRLVQPIVSMASTPDGRGYWLVAADGGIFAFGDAHFHGSTGGVRLAQPIVGMAATTTGNGYWMVAADGGIFAFGDAGFHGSTGGVRLVKPIVGMSATYGGGGYYLVASDGGVFAFGNAPFYGSTGGIKLVQPIVGMAS